MQKLDPFQISSRLHDKLNNLRAGKEVAARDLKVLLSDECIAAIDQAWAEQQALRKKKRARTKEEEAALGWKSKRQIQIESVEAELAMHDSNAEACIEKDDAEQRGAKILMDAVSNGIREGKTPDQAMNMANNDLTRARLQRADGYVSRRLNSRDQEILELEQSIMRKHESEMDDYGREQLELLRETEREERTERTQRTKR